MAPVRDKTNNRSRMSTATRTRTYKDSLRVHERPVKIRVRLKPYPRLERRTRLAKHHAAPSWSGWHAVRDELYHAAIFFHSVNPHLRQHGSDKYKEQGK